MPGFEWAHALSQHYGLQGTVEIHSERFGNARQLLVIHHQCKHGNRQVNKTIKRRTFDHVVQKCKSACCLPRKAYTQRTEVSTDRQAETQTYAQTDKSLRTFTHLGER